MTIERSRPRRYLLGAMILIAGSLWLGFKADRPLDELMPLYASEASKFVEINGMRVHFRDEGDGPPLVLIHGSNSSLHTWDSWVATLRSKHRIVRLDLPGHGLTGPSPAARYDYSAMTDVLDRLIKTLRLEKFSLVGNSMGGAIALEYTFQHADQVDNLILVNSIGYPDEVPPVALRMWGYPVLGSVLTCITPRFVYKQTLRDAYGDATLITEPLVDRYYDLLLRAGNRVATRDRFVQNAFAVSVPSLASIRAKTLILWGGKDRWFPVHFGERFARDIPEAQLKVYPTLGHVPMEEAPEETARDVLEFLSSGHP